jgi:hypothetical protein
VRRDHPGGAGPVCEPGRLVSVEWGVALAARRAPATGARLPRLGAACCRRAPAPHPADLPHARLAA